MAASFSQRRRRDRRGGGALSPEDQVRAIRDMLNAGGMLMRQSPQAEFLRTYTEEQENRAQQVVKEFIARHAQ